MNEDMLVRLARYGVHKTLPFVVLATSEGFYNGYVGFDKEIKHIIDERNIDLDNISKNITISFNENFLPYPKGNPHFKTMDYWIGFDNNHVFNVPSVDMIVEYFPDEYGFDIDHLARISRRIRSNPSGVFVTEDETENLCKQIIDTIMNGVV